MPCNGDHLNPNEAEENSKECAEHIFFIAQKLANGKQFDKSMKLFNVTAEDINKGMDEYYGIPEKVESLTQVLCHLCTNMSLSQKNSIMYDGRNSQSRKLANWWDEHCKADILRKEQEHEAESKTPQYQINSAVFACRGRIENGADVDEALTWLEEETAQIFDGVLFYD